MGASFLTNPSTQSQQTTSSAETLKNDPSPPPPGTSQVLPVMMWASSSSNSPPDVMMPPPVLVANSLINRRSSSNLQLILPDNLKTEVLDENSENSMLSENSMQSIPTPTTTNGPTSATSPLQQLVNENSREATSSQADIIRTVAVATASNSPVREAVSGLLGVVDLMRNQHPLSMVNAHHPTSFASRCNKNLKNYLLK